MEKLYMIFGVTLFLGMVGLGVYSQTTVESYTDCVVEDKDRTRSSGSSSDMRLYTSCGIFKVGDDLWTWQWDSADRYHAIQEGETYDFTTRGIRLGFFSMFPKVIGHL